MPHDVPRHEGAEAAVPGVDSGKHHMKHQLRWLGLTRAVRPVVGGASRSEQPSAAQSGRQSQEARVAWCRTAKTGGSDRLFAPQRVLREDKLHEIDFGLVSRAVL